MTIAIDEVKPSVRMTGDQFERLPKIPNYELVHGTLAEKKMGAESDWIANVIAAVLTSFVRDRKLGLVFGETSYRLAPDDPDHYRKPDASFVAMGRLPDNRIPTGFMRLAPDLAVEVVSPGDLASEVAKKVEEYLAYGVRLIWIVQPETRTIEIRRVDGSVSVLHDTDTISGEDVVPGFAAAIADFFPPR